MPPLAPAVFLDRDGVLTEERSYILRPEDLVLTHGAAAALRLLNASPFRAVVVTNQSAVGRGLCTLETLEAIHARMRELFEAQGVRVDGLYFCPHAPGEPGCLCRKPEPGMVIQAAQEMNLDLSRSWMIGDTTADIALAYNVGIRSILVRTGYGGNDGKVRANPDHIADDIEAAVAMILAGNS